MTFGKRLYQLRKEKNLSQEELAEQLNVSRQSVSRWENGTASPGFDKMIQLSEIFGVTTDHLLKGREPSNTAPVTVRTPLNRIIGCVLLVLGALTGLYGLLHGSYFDYYLLLTLPFLLCGGLCLFCKNHIPLYCLWTVYYCITFFLYLSFNWHWGMYGLTFRQVHAAYKPQILASWILLAVLLGILVFTAWYFHKIPVTNPKRHLILTLALPAIYLMLIPLFHVISTNLLTNHLALVHSGTFAAMNLLISFTKQTLFALFSISIARWIYYKKSNR